MQFLKKLWAFRSRSQTSDRIDDKLSARSESGLGLVPTLPEGSAGHDQLLAIFYSLLSEAKPSVFCDIGANQGEAGRRALRVVPGIRVISFEANPEIHRQYREINEQAGVRWMNLAVSDEIGQVALNIPRTLDRALIDGRLVQGKRAEARDTGKSSLLLRDENATYDTVMVSAATLDAFLADEAPSQSLALWIDVEGAASKVLNGAHQAMARTDLLLVEVEGFAFWKDQKLIDEILDLLKRQGFVPVLRDREYGDAQFNVLFLRSAAAGFDAWLSRISATLDERRMSAPTVVHSVKEASPANTPVLIPCFNNPSYSRLMVSQLIGLGFEQITLVDNASDSQEMVALLRTLEIEGVDVQRLEQNDGPRNSIFTKERLEGLPRKFCVTDPDIAFNLQLPPDFLPILEDAAGRCDEFKAGFALDISRPDLLKANKFKIGAKLYKIAEWEEQFWRQRIGFAASGDPIFRAGIDTTFALYDRDKLDMARFISGLRIGGRFTATHLPWLDRSTMTSAEENHYRKSQKHSYYLGADIS